MRVSATQLTFALGLICLAIVGYSTVAFINLSFHQIEGAASIPQFVVRQRTALAALAMTVGIACVIMGFAAFMIGAKGEINVNAETAWLKGALVSGVPGPFFVLCGTVITLTVLFMRVSYEEFAPSFAGQPVSGNATPGVVASRTIAFSDQRAALFTEDTGVYNALMTIAAGDAAAASDDEVRYLIANADRLALVLVRWNPNRQQLADETIVDLDDASRRREASQGYLLVPERDGAAQSVTAVLQAGQLVSNSLPSSDGIPPDRVARVVRSALSQRVVFRRGER